MKFLHVGTNIATNTIHTNTVNTKCVKKYVLYFLE